ncbi:BCCT family transporter [Fusibacter bizertensis]|uniref:BCCT family transporter n=1 Tax=Fusibacter bizertensis TaxID=1488331 RepID=A0ABT6NHK8_9FIRM|nr:BCCT family transporter [Fusibacter bizertensis]MDH8679910.1 BCCT family transporter [Fusibacter bizertensis]
MSKKIIKLKKELHDRNFTKFGLDLNLTVSGLSALLLIAFSAYAFLNLDKASEQLTAFKAMIIERFDTVFIFSANLFIVALILLAVMKSGKIRLGGDDAKPEFSTFSWYAMLMSAGMGIGLMFWSVGEPIYHQVGSPIFASSTSRYTALATTFFHWGIHPWAIYGIISLALAYFTFNKKLPLSPRSFFYPIFKEKIFGLLGDIIDTLAVLAALAGLATSLGLGVQQINSGLTHIFGLPNNILMQVALIAVITLIATASVVSGIDKGVKFLSELNIKAAFVLMMIVLLVGPTFTIFKDIFMSTGLYIKGFVNASLNVNSLDAGWSQGWTIFYWAWWISWSPFVGMFIAKISRGRTIREFITAVLVVPTLLSIVWLGVFGSTALNIDAATAGAVTEAVNSNLSIALFEMVQLIDAPFFVDVLKVIVNALAVFLVITFFVTSSDSGSLVVDSLASGGKLKSPVGQRVFWALMEGFIAAVLLIIGGKQALSILQAAVITTGLPFAIIITVVTVLLINELIVKEWLAQNALKKAMKQTKPVDVE